MANHKTNRQTIMSDFDKILKEVDAFSRLQQNVFEENIRLAKVNKDNRFILEEIRRNYDTEIQKISAVDSSDPALLLVNIYSKSTVEEQISYFSNTIEPKKDFYKRSSQLSEEYARVSAFVTTNVNDYFCEYLEHNYSRLKKDTKLLDFDRFLKFQGKLDHVDKGLKVVLTKFVEEMRNKIVQEGTQISRIFALYLDDLAHIFTDVEKLNINFVSNLLTQIQNSLISEFFTTFNNDIYNLIAVNLRLFEFYQFLETSYPSIQDSTRAVAYATFSTFNNYLSTYGDKFELLAVLDANYEFLYALFKRYETKNFKVWLIDMVTQYIDNTFHQSNNNIFEKNLLVFRLSKQTYKSFDNLLKTRLKSLDLEFKDYLKYELMDMSDETEKSLEKADVGKTAEVVSFFKTFFERELKKLDSILSKLKSLKVKDSEFRKKILEFCVEEFCNFYRKALNKFLNVELQGIDKKNIFKLYANEVEKKMKDELMIN